jgi:U4/U6 small nuclear ribonucleoprotein PRP4
MQGHKDRILSLQFSGTKHNLLASGSADATARVWCVRDVDDADAETLNSNIETAAPSEMMETMMEKHDGERGKLSKENSSITMRKLKSVLTLSGHALRLSAVAWHPMEKHLATSSYDHTWRLWDTVTGNELLLQEGHGAPVYGLAFHKDGSLAMSGDLMGIGRLWDLRSGKSIHTLLGHAAGLICSDFSVDGIQLATGSLDNSVRLWDLRSHCKPLAVIPAHMHAVSRVRFDPIDGAFLVTSSYDRSCKVWDTRSHRMITELRAHDHLVMDLDICSNSRRLVTCSYDRTWKLWIPSILPK